MFLRRLHEANGGIDEGGDEILQPVRRHHIVSDDDADDLGVGRGALHCDAQRAGFEADHLLRIDEDEALAERAAVILDRLPECGIRRVVDDDDALEVRIIEPGDGIQRLLEHLRRLEIRWNVNRDYRECAGGRRGQGRGEQALRTAAEGDGGDFLDSRHRDQHQRHQQDHAERQGEGGAEHEVVRVPVGEYGGEPCADAVGRDGEQENLRNGRLHQAENGQRHQDADQHRDQRHLPVIGIGDRPGPWEFRFTRCVQNAPVRADTTFEKLPRLVDGFDDVVVEPDRLGAGHEVAQDRRLFEWARIRALQVVPLTRPAKLRDHHSLAGKTVPQQLGDRHGVIDGRSGRNIVPVGQDMRGDEVHGRGESRLVTPHTPDFACGDRDIDLPLHALDVVDQLIDLQIGTVERFVADDDADDVGVVLGEVNGGGDLTLIAVDILVEPGADRDLQSEFVGDRRHQFDAAGGRIKADRLGDLGQFAEIVPDFLDARDIVDVGMAGSLERRIRYARQQAAEVWRGFLPLEQTPEGGMSRGHKNQNGDYRAHRKPLRPTWQDTGSVPGPVVTKTPIQSRFYMTRFNIWYGVVAFLWAQADMRRLRAAKRGRIILT